MALGLYSTFIRYFRGLGAVSNMTDQFPWGFWIGFDCLCGVMLAAGGFCVIGAVYLFNHDDSIIDNQPDGRRNGAQSHNI